MAKCLLCLEEKDNLTEEHVFPAALGGTLVIDKSVCAGCNNGCSKFEQPVIRELTGFRLLLKIPDRYGNIPNAPAVVKTGEKEYEARIKGDGTVQPKPIVTEVKKDDGTREFIHQFATPRLREKLKKEAEERGGELIELGPGEPVVAEIHGGGELELIGTSEGLRTASKIAYVGLAYCAGVDLAMRDTFAEIRAHITEGVGKPTRIFVLERYLQACRQGPHQHSIVLAARRADKRVDAILRLFGGLCYFVNLSDKYEGADFSNTLAFDAQRGEKCDVLYSHELSEFLQIGDVATNKDTVWNDLPAWCKRFIEFIDQAVQAKQASSGNSEYTSAGQKESFAG